MNTPTRTTLTFHDFATLVNGQLEAMTADDQEVYLTTATKDEVWDTYLTSFPPGTNPIFREKTEHDCSCCRSFVKNLGAIVTLRPDGTYSTVWDSLNIGTYGVVAGAVGDLLRSRPIAQVYRTQEGGYGAETTKEAVEGGPDIDWNHFHGKVPRQCQSRTPG